MLYLQLKTELLQNLEILRTEDNKIQMQGLKIQFYTSEEIPETASKDFLPIIMNNKGHPINFSSVNYYKVSFSMFETINANFSIF